MAVKTITIDLDAYEILSHRLGTRVTGADLRAALRRSRLSEDTLDAIDAQVRARRSSAARSPRL